MPHFRIPEDEECQVYEGFEIASHTRTHVNLARCTEEERRSQIGDDVAALSRLFGRQVIGFAYPYGTGAKQSAEALKAAGVHYARTASPVASAYCYEVTSERCSAFASRSLA